MTIRTQENKDRERNLKILVRKWLVKQETSEKAKLLLKKNPRIKSGGLIQKNK